jgi:hypothetical protein
MINMLWGVIGSVNNTKVIEKINGETPDFNIINDVTINDKTVKVSGVLMNENYYKYRGDYSAFIGAIARTKLNNLMDKLDRENIVYCHTDGVITTGEIPKGIIKDKVGEPRIKRYGKVVKINNVNNVEWFI